MSQRIRAVFHDGAFVPQQPCDLPEGSEVELIVERSHVLPPEEKDPDERKRILKEVVEDMRSNPFPENAPRFTREDLHERR
jgi:predicted DNA-binding antitoxin AbrB/MazE fold protein